MNTEYKGIKISADEDIVSELKDKHNISFEKEIKDAIDLMISNNTKNVENLIN